MATHNTTLALSSSARSTNVIIMACQIHTYVEVTVNTYLCNVFKPKTIVASRGFSPVTVKLRDGSLTALSFLAGRDALLSLAAS